MATKKPTLPPESREEQDSAYNPGDLIAREKFGDGTPKKPTDEAKDAAKKADQAEQEIGAGGEKDGYYRKTGKSPRGSRKLTLKGWLTRRKSVVAGVIIALLGGTGAFSIILAPGLGIVQLKEVFVKDLNDQLAAYDLRSTQMWRAKLKSLQNPGSICSDVVKIRCQFRSMSERTIIRFDAEFSKAGYKIEYDQIGEKRYRITGIEAPDGTRLSNPNDLMNRLGDTDTRKALNRVHNPIYRSVSDYVADNVLKNRFFTSKASKLTGSTKEEFDESLRNNTTGDTPDSTRAVLVDENGDRYILDENGEKVYEKDEPTRYRSILAETEAKASGFDAKAEERLSTGTKAVSGVLSGALKGVSILGVTDSACTIYNLAKAVEAAAKLARAVQLAQYAMVFHNTADKIKAGDATPEETEYIGNILTATDNRTMITDEGSALNGATSVEEAQEMASNGQLLRENPDYGKDAFSSNGYKIAAYNEAPELSARSAQYTIGGGMVGSLSEVNKIVTDTFGGQDATQQACGVIQSFWVRAIGLTIGVIAALGSFGASTVISIGASLALSLAAPLLEAMLTDIVAGQVVTPETQGVESGDAIFAGTGALMGGFAQNRALKPLTDDEIGGYLEVSRNVEAEYERIARDDAKDTPFDIMNQYSFLGSLARSVNIPLTRAASSVNGALLSVPTILSSSLAAIIPNAQAQYAYNPDRFRLCTDSGYDYLGIAADVFCNVRYGLLPEDLERDPLENMEWMIEEGYVNEDGLALPGNYKEFLTYCVEREDGWGPTGQEQENDWTTGKACMGDSTTISGLDDDTLSRFRTYTIDTQVSYGINGDEPPEEPEGGATTTTGSSDKAALARKILDKGRITFNSGVVPKLEEIASGKTDPDALRCGVNIYILRILDAVTDKYSIHVSSWNRACEDDVPVGSSTRSRHYAGNGSAIDISAINGVGTNGRDANAQGVLKIAMPYLAEAAARSGTYAGIGQLQCGGLSTVPGIFVFEDFCNHIHIDVAAWADPNLEYIPGGW